MSSFTQSAAEQLATSFKKWFLPSPSGALRGGLALPRNKPGLPIVAGEEIKTLSLADTVCIPLLNYQREVVESTLSIGQSVRPGDFVAHGIIASCHGVISGIEHRAINHPSGIKAPCVVISTNKEMPMNKALYPAEERITAQRISACAIRGLGGAGFKTTDKLNAIQATEHNVLDTLIINAIECEPLISCDESLIESQAQSIVKAIEGLIDFTQCRRCILAIENDKTSAIKQLELAIHEYPNDVHFETAYLAPIYPAGAERPLVERLTGKQIPGNIFPASLGILCLNVATVLATEHARLGHPMVSRIVTIAGDLCEHPTNVRVTFGTSIYDVIKETRNLSNLDKASVRVGGPISGFFVEDLSAPITATTNCITLECSVAPEQIHPCIRCGACSDVCPVNLLPQQLNTYCLNEELEKANVFNLSECIECACCDIVCPSNIPLTQVFRFAKGLVREQDRQTSLASEAESRYQKREIRVAGRLEKRALKREVARAQLASSKDPIADALARAKKRRKRSADD